MTVPDAEVARWQRSLLPGGLVAGEEARRSPRDWAMDVFICVVAVLGGLVLPAGTGASPRARPPRRRRARCARRAASR